MKSLKPENNLLEKSARYSILYRYISQEFLLSFAICFLFFFFIFFVNQLLLMAEVILSKRVPLRFVIMLVFFATPSIIALSFPFATLVGALMTFGRFSSDNEIIAFKTCGISQNRIFVPLAVIGVVFSLLSFVVNDYFLPLGTLNFTRLYKKMVALNPEMELEAYSIKEYQDTIIVIGDVSDKVIHNILIIKRDQDVKRIIQAETARMVDLYENESVISLELSNVFSHTYRLRDRNSYSWLTADRMIFNILLKDIAYSLQNPGPREMRSVDVQKTINEKKKVFRDRKDSHGRNLETSGWQLDLEYRSLNQRQESPDISGLDNYLNNYTTAAKTKLEDRSLKVWQLELYQKFSIPFSCIPFILLAFPLGLLTRKSGRSVGFGLGLLISVLYWCLLVLGRTLGIRSGFDPFLTMWIPNIIILVIGLFLYIDRVAK
jgi:lipopolysaccharide export system permease protein